MTILKETREQSAPTAKEVDVEPRKQSAPTAKETDVVVLLVFVDPRMTSHHFQEIGEQSAPKEVEPCPRTAPCRR